MRSGRLMARLFGPKRNIVSKMRPIRVSRKTLLTCWDNKWFYGRFTSDLDVDIEMGMYPGTPETQRLVVDSDGELEVNCAPQDLEGAESDLQPAVEDNQLPVEEREKVPCGQPLQLLLATALTGSPTVTPDVAEPNCPSSIKAVQAQSDEGRMAVEGRLTIKPVNWGEDIGGTEVPKESCFADQAVQAQDRSSDEGKSTPKIKPGNWGEGIDGTEATNKARIAPQERKGLKQQVVSMTRQLPRTEKLSTQIVMPVTSATSVQPTASGTQEEGNDPGVPEEGRGSFFKAGTGRDVALGAVEDMPSPPRLAPDLWALQGPRPPNPGVKRKGRGFTSTSNSVLAPALDGALPNGEPDLQSHGGSSQRRNSEAQATPPMQDNPEGNAPEDAPDIAIGAPPADLLAAPPAAPPAALPAAPPAGAPHGPPPGLPAWVAAPRPEIRHKRPLQKAHLATLPRAPLTHLPEEAEEGDVETAQLILRNEARQREEEERQEREARRTAIFNRRTWELGRGCRDLWARKMSKKQVQEKVLGAMDAYVEREEPAELRDKVQGLLPNTEASFIVEQVPLLAIRQRPGVDWRHITEVMLYLCSGEQFTLPKPAVQRGTRALLNTMGRESVVRQTPQAADWVGGVMGALVNGGVLSLKEVATATLQAARGRNGVEGQLVSSGAALKLMGAVLQVVARDSSEAQMCRQWKDTGLELHNFLPSSERDGDDKSRSQRLQAICKVYPCLQALIPMPNKGKGATSTRRR